MKETAPSHLGKLCQIEEVALFQCFTRSSYWLEHRKVSFLYTNWEMQLFVSINSYSMLVLIGKVWTLVIAINMLFLKEVVKRHRQPAGHSSMDLLMSYSHCTAWTARLLQLSHLSVQHLSWNTCAAGKKQFREIRVKQATYRCEALNNKEQWKGSHFQTSSVSTPSPLKSKAFRKQGTAGPL